MHCPLCHGSDEVSKDEARAYVELVERNAVLWDRIALAERELGLLSRHIPQENRGELKAISTRLVWGGAYLRSPSYEASYESLATASTNDNHAG